MGSNHRAQTEHAGQQPHAQTFRRWVGTQLKKGTPLIHITRHHCFVFLNLQILVLLIFNWSNNPVRIKWRNAWDANQWRTSLICTHQHLKTQRGYRNICIEGLWFGSSGILLTHTEYFVFKLHIVSYIFYIRRCHANANDIAMDDCQTDMLP